MGSYIGSGDRFAAVALPAGSATGIWLYSDPTLQGKTQQSIRVAPHSASKGYIGIEVYEVNGSVAVTFKEKDVDGVSLARTDPEINWAPVAYHF